MTATTLLALLGVLLAAGPALPSDRAVEEVLAAENRRVQTIERIAPAVVSIFDAARRGGGSGVLIDEHGYGLTNFHVIAGMTPAGGGHGGLSDGQLYPLEVLGIDVTGDLAMFRLSGRERFPFAPLGDSDAVRVGDEVLALGNPFVLAEDFIPTVTAGIVTGVHRYQGEGEDLIYTDCIQTDAAINPGNSGGPLFDAQGRVIGINGRISAAMHRFARGRYNVGLGYAISINQIRRFMPTLRAGLLARHGTLLATVVDDVDGVIFNDMYEDAPAWKAGIRLGDRLVRFGGVEIRTANQFLSLLGTYPENWPVPITFQSHGRLIHRVVRLEGVTPNLRHPYIVPQAVNREAAEVTLRAFRRAVGLEDENRTPRTWSWTARRVVQGDKELSYSVHDGGRGAEQHEVLEDGKPRQVFRIEGADVVDGQERSPAREPEHLACVGLQTLRRRLLCGGPVWNEDRVRHAGADAITTIDDEGNIVRARRLETVSVALSDEWTVRVGFDLDSHMPARIVVQGPTPQVKVEIELDDYRSAGGIIWPHQMKVRSDKLSFEETISDLEVGF